MIPPDKYLNIVTNSQDNVECDPGILDGQPKVRKPVINNFHVLVQYLTLLTQHRIEKLSKSPQAESSSDNLNMLHRFDNNSYTGFGTVYKLILIPSYVIQVI